MLATIARSERGSRTPLYISHGALNFDLERKNYTGHYLDGVVVGAGNDSFAIELDAPDGGDVTHEYASAFACSHIPYAQRRVTRARYHAENSDVCRIIARSVGN